jgi:CDP-diacylglycerol--glycerol-3-phosphate 3-phosphatidyltransferase
MTGSLVSPRARERVRSLALPMALFFGRLGLTPNMLTLIGFGFAIVAAGAAATQNWLWAGILVVFGGVFDLFDGALARATGKAGPLGAFMDSVFDRWGEVIIYVGIVWGALEMGLSRPVILAAAAMASAVMVSYARAKSESEGFTPGKGMANVGLAPREVRIVILTIGLILAGLLPGLPEDTSGAAGAAYPYPLSALALDVSLGLITLLAAITVVQRVVHVINQSKQQQPVDP